MSGHRDKAKDLLKGYTLTPVDVALAQVHATLAVADATQAVAAQTADLVEVLRQFHHPDRGSGILVWEG